MDHLIKYEQGFDNATKEDLIQSAQVTIFELIEGGNVDVMKEYARVRKAMLFFEQVEKALRTHAIDDVDLFGDNAESCGVKLSVTNGTTTLMYKEDAVVSELQEKIKERQALVKLATNSKDMIFDNNGVSVESVSKKESERNIMATIK